MPSAYNTVTRHKASTGTRWHFAFVLCCHSNETRAPITNLPNGAQLGGTPTIAPSYIRVCAVVWACGNGQTDTQRHTQAEIQTHRHAWPIYILRHLRQTGNVIRKHCIRVQSVQFKSESKCKKYALNATRAHGETQVLHHRLYQPQLWTTVG